MPLLFRVIPRYLYVSVSSSSVLPMVSVLWLSGFPIVRTLLFWLTNFILYLDATLYVMSSISCSVFLLVLMRTTSSIHRKHPIVSSLPVLIGCMLLLISSFDISSIMFAFSTTARTPPCLMLSLICILLVCPLFVLILAVMFSFNFFAMVHVNDQLVINCTTAVRHV